METLNKPNQAREAAMALIKEIAIAVPSIIAIELLSSVILKQLGVDLGLNTMTAMSGGSYASTRFLLSGQSRSRS